MSLFRSGVAGEPMLGIIREIASAPEDEDSADGIRLRWIGVGVLEVIQRRVHRENTEGGGGGGGGGGNGDSW